MNGASTPVSPGVNNRETVSGLGFSPLMIGSGGFRITSSVTSMITGTVGTGISILSFRVNLGPNNASGGLGLQGPGRPINSVLQQAMEDDDEQSDSTNKQGRAKPKNPRLAVGKSTLEEFTQKLENRLQSYEEQNHADLLFSPEERRALNKKRPNFEILASEKWPLFHTLAVSGDSLSVDRLLKQNFDVDALDKDGYTALQRAVLAKKETVVNQLLRAKADISVCDKAGATLLHYSVQTGSMNLVRSFLTCGVDVNAADKYGWTPLHLAVLTGRADIVRLLLISGADKTSANKDGLTPLDLCFCLGRAFNSIEIAKALKRFPKENPASNLVGR